MTPLQDFAREVTDARRVFDAGRTVAAWIVFYEAKQTAYAKLSAALPQVRAVEDFWRYVQNMAQAAWLPIIDCEIKRITFEKYLCRDCKSVQISWPKLVCGNCRTQRRIESYQKAKERMRVKQRMRKCPVCKVEPLNPRCRICPNCQLASRKSRNQRYQKSLKGGSVRRVRGNFTRERMSTLRGGRTIIPTSRTVDSEGVLTRAVA
jgi:hypothetical protein